MILVVLLTHAELASATVRGRSYWETGQLTANNDNIHNIKASYTTSHHQSQKNSNSIVHYCFPPLIQFLKRESEKGNSSAASGPGLTSTSHLINSVLSPGGMMHCSCDSIELVQRSNFDDGRGWWKIYLKLNPDNDLTSYQTRGSTQGNLIPPNFKNGSGKRTFRYRGAVSWNKLPAACKNHIPLTANQFKCALKFHC